MRSVFTAEDMKCIIRNVFNNNDDAMVTISQVDMSQETMNIVQYLNIDFYTWKDRVVGTEGFDAWEQSIDLSMNKAYGLVEVVDASAVASQDIDSGSITAKVTVILQAEKAAILDSFVSKIRNKYLGLPQEIQNENGDIIKAYLNIGALLYDSEPSMTQFGESIIVSFAFIMNYMNDALTYSDEKISVSLDGTNYYPLSYTAATWQNICTTQAVAKYSRPDITGFLSSAVSTMLTLTYYDFRDDACNALRAVTERMGAVSVGGTATTVGAVNIPVHIKKEIDGTAYIYDMIIDNTQRVAQNGAFTTCSITLKGNGKKNAV